MALPKRRVSKTRRDKRRSHNKLMYPNLSLCPKCKEPKRSHYVCPNCGYYKDREIIVVKKS